MAGRFGTYDPSTQMYLSDLAEPSLNHLRFLRYLAEKEMLEHPVASEPQGLYSLADELEKEMGR